MTRRDPAEIARKNKRMGLAVAGVVAGMVGLSYAAVPLYNLFCAVTGFNGTPMIGQAAPGAAQGAGRITVRFNANTQPNLPWRFAPEQPSVEVRHGEEQLAFYTAHNNGAVPVTGVSTYNVTPEVVGKYFHKTACFCFESQTLGPGETVQMPLAFWVDPKIAEDPNTAGIRTITINYSFFRSLDDAARNGALANAGEHVGKLVR